MLSGGLQSTFMSRAAPAHPLLVLDEDPNKLSCSTQSDKVR